MDKKINRIAFDNHIWAEEGFTYYLSNSFWCSLIILLIEEDIRKIKCFTHTNLKIITLMSLNLNVASSVINSMLDGHTIKRLDLLLRADLG
jgi:hypothetical protein